MRSTFVRTAALAALSALAGAGATMAPLGVETVSTPTGLGVVTAQAATGTFNLPAITGPVTSLSCPGEVIWPPPPGTLPPIPPDAIGIVGRITDAKSGQLLQDALVSVVDTEFTTLANLYEVVPAGSEVPRAVDELRYQPEPDDPPLSEFGGEMMYVKVRYKDPDGAKSRLLELAVAERTVSPSADFRFASAVAGFGMLLRDSEHAGDLTLGDVVKLAENARGDDPRGYRGEFIRLVEATRDLGLLRRETEGS